MVYRVKVCFWCGQDYQPTNGRQKYCAACRIRGRAIRKAAYYVVNLEKIGPRRIARYAANPEKEKTQQAAHRAACPEIIRASAAKFGAAHPERIREWGSVYKKNHPENRRLEVERRRALKYSNTPIDEMLTSTEWLAILAEANGHCTYCDKEALLTLDHVIPLSRGGKHSKDNVVPACQRCNSSKNARTPEEWCQAMGVEI